MHKISEGYVDEHNTEMVKCPKCGSEDVIANTNTGYFWIEKCNSCGYVKKNNKPDSK